MKHSLKLVMIVALGLWMFTATTPAQEIYTSITGVVTDPTGAVVPGATVTVTNESSGVSFTTQTDSTGRYTVLRLIPGKYTVRVEAAGFRTAVLRGIELVVAVRGVANVQLEVGEVTEVVEVQAASAPMVETTTMQTGGTIEERQIVDLPLVTRNWTQLNRLFAGSQEPSDRLGNSINGQRTTANNFLINGVDSNDPPLNTPIATPSPDSIAEFRFINSTFNPEYSRNSGSILNAVTKTGSNEFHGSLFYFYRQKGLSARNFFVDNKPDFIRHQWGATAGGPIWKEHTFFFWSYQGLRQNAPNVLGKQRIFTPAERDADGDGIFDWSADYPDGIPGTSPGIPGCPAGMAFADCFPNAQIPRESVHPLALNVINGLSGLFPSLPFGNSGDAFFVPVDQITTKNFEWSLRVDHHWKAGHSLDGYFYQRNQTTTSTIPFTGATVPGFGDKSVPNVRQLSLTYTHVFNPRVLAEFRLGYSRLDFRAVFPQNIFQPKDAGFQGIVPQNPAVASAPNIVLFSGWFDWGFSRNGPQPRVDQTFEYVGNVSIIHGTHNSKVGFDIRNVDVFNPFNFAHNGVYQFRGIRIPGGNSADPGLEFLLGLPTLYFQASGAVNEGATEEYYVYVQDQWHIRPNFTLTYGTGWQLDTPTEQLFADKQLQMQLCPGQRTVLFPSGVQDPVNGPFIGPPSGLCYPADPQVPAGTIPLRKHNFAPRIGFAWSPSAESGFLHWLTGGPNNFSIRGGYGIYYNVLIEETNLQFLLVPPFSLINVQVFQNFTFPFCPQDNPNCGIQFFPFAVPKAGDVVDWFALGFLPLNQQVFDPNFRTPYSQNFQLTIERQFSRDWLFRIAYVGSRGNNLIGAEELLDAGVAPDGTPLPTFPGGRTLMAARDPSFGDPNIWQSVGVQNSTAQSFYHSLQLTMEKRYSKNFMFLASYTLSKAIDDTSNNGIEDRALTPRFHARDRALSDFDARHKFVLSYIVDLPAPKWEGALGKFARGWSISGITTFASGFPVTLTTSTDCDPAVTTSFFGSWCRPDITGSGSPKTFNPREKANNQFFDTSMFTEPAPGSLGNASARFFHGPGTNNWDIAILKNTYIDEQRYLQARFEFFNAFNHTQFNTPSGNVSSSNFGRVTSAAPARRIQLAIKFVF